MPEAKIDFAEIVRRGKQEGWYATHANDVDYADWARQQFWSPEHAAALAFGLDPYAVDWEKLKSGIDKSDIARRIALFLKRVGDTQWDEIALPMRPHLFLEWTIARGYPMPSGLMKAVEQYGIPVINLRDRCQALEKKLAALEEIAASGASEQKLTKKLLPKEEQSLLKLVLGMAMKKFGYRPRRNSSAPSTIVRSLQEFGIELSEDTVLKWLRRAEAEVDFEPPPEP